MQNLFLHTFKRDAACKLWIQMFESWVEMQQVDTATNEPITVIYQTQAIPTENNEWNKNP